MIIRCVEKPHWLSINSDITIEKEYESLGYVKEHHKVIDDAGCPWHFDKKYFEVVDGAEVVNSIIDDLKTKLDDMIDDLNKIGEPTQDTDKNKNQYEHRPNTVIQTVRDLTK